MLAVLLLLLLSLLSTRLFVKSGYDCGQHCVLKMLIKVQLIKLLN